MSKSSGKHDKFSCLVNCLPMAGCLHKSRKRRPTVVPTGVSVTYNLTGGGGKTDGPFGVGAVTVDDEGLENLRLEHTKQWLQNLSTEVTFDPSYLNDSELNAMDETMTDENPKIRGRDRAKNRMDSARGSSKDGGSCEDSRNRRHGSRSSSAQSQNEPRRSRDDQEIGLDQFGNDSHATQRHDNTRQSVDTSYMNGGNHIDDSYRSSVTCDSSRLSGSGCCSEQRRSRQHHDRHRSCTSSSSAVKHPTPNRGYSAADESSAYSGGSSTVSLATELVSLDVDSCRYLGITIVGHSNAQGDCGIFVGCVKKGGAAALNGRIEPGDLILEVNDIDLEQMSNEDALAALKAELHKGGTVRILVAKYWDMNSSECGAPPENGCRLEPVYESMGSLRSMSSSTRRSASVTGRGGYEGSRGESVAGAVVQGVNSLRRADNTLRSIPEDNSSGRVRQFHEATGMSSSELDKLYDLSKAARVSAAARSQQHLNTGGYVHSSGHAIQSSSASSVLTAGYPDSGYHDGGGRHVVATNRVGGGGGGSVQSLPQHSSTLDRRLRQAVLGESAERRIESSSSGPPSSRPFRGVELIDWIQGQVVGLRARTEAQAYAQNLLVNGHIRSVDPRQGAVFHEHNYYALGLASSFGEGPLQSRML